MSTNTVKSTRGLKIALSRKANQLNVKVTNLVLNGTTVSFSVEPSTVEVVATLNAIATKLGYSVSNSPVVAAVVTTPTV